MHSWLGVGVMWVCRILQNTDKIMLIQQNVVYLDRVFPSVEGGKQRVSMYVLWGI